MESKFFTKEDIRNLNEDFSKSQQECSEKDILLHCTRKYDKDILNVTMTHESNLNVANMDKIKAMGNLLNECDCAHTSQNSFVENMPINNSLYFSDGLRSVDYVLVWSKVMAESMEKINVCKRKIFEENLINQGLETEIESTEELNFVKIHAPLEVLRRYSEILKLRMPMKESLCKVHTNECLSRLLNAAQNITQKEILKQENIEINHKYLFEYKFLHIEN